jgi:hypothetical protein
MDDKQKSLVRKWSKTGLLRKVDDRDVLEVTLRLERAARMSLEVGSVAVLEAQIELIRDEGLFGT